MNVARVDTHGSGVQVGRVCQIKQIVDNEPVVGIYLEIAGRPFPALLVTDKIQIEGIVDISGSSFAHPDP